MVVYIGNSSKMTLEWELELCYITLAQGDNRGPDRDMIVLAKELQIFRFWYWECMRTFDCTLGEVLDITNELSSKLLLLGDYILRAIRKVTSKSHIRDP